MKKILGVCDPVIDVYTGYACINSMLLTDERGIGWFAQNYIHTASFYNETLDFCYTDYLNFDTVYLNSIVYFQPEQMLNWPVSVYSVPREQVPVEGFLDFVRKQIDLGYGICLFVDLKYLRDYGYDLSGIHEIFIYGYDDEEEVVFATGYAKGTSYRSMKHPYSQVVFSYAEPDDTIGFNRDVTRKFNVNRISLLHWNEDYEFKFSKEQFERDIRYYLNEEEWSFAPCIRNTRMGKHSMAAYGNRVYDVLASNVKKKCQQQDEIDIRQIYFLHNKQQGLKFKIPYFERQGFLKDSRLVREQVDDLLKESKSLLFTGMEYNRRIQTRKKTKPGTVEKMVEKLERVKRTEEVVLKGLCNKIK